jgi:hypothetical protein
MAGPLGRPFFRPGNNRHWKALRRVVSVRRLSPFSTPLRPGSRLGCEAGYSGRCSKTATVFLARSWYSADA